VGGFQMQIKGLTKTTLSDYPGHVAATVFVGGCDFRCPFCYNKSLVIQSDKLPSIPLEEVYEFLEKRQGALEGVCVTGGEPLTQDDLCDFIYNVKLMGYKVKLDTNGYDPTHLNHIIRNNLVDYIAMDIKNSKENYAKTAGLTSFDMNRIKLSAELLMGSDIKYEFRTTLVKQLHTSEDIEEIGRWLRGAKAYFLQSYTETEDVIMPIFGGYSKKELLAMKKILMQYINRVEIRGI